MKYAIFLFLAVLTIGALDGTMDKLQFHYGKSVFRSFENQSFWNPKISWERKYQRDAEGVLVQPLRRAYFGSTTFLVFTTDAWHLAKELKMAIWRSLLVIALTLALALVDYVPKWYEVTGIWLGLWLIQAAGFHLLYSWILQA